MVEPSLFDIASCDTYEVLKRMLLRLKEIGYIYEEAREEVEKSEYFRNLPPHLQMMPEGFDDWSCIQHPLLFTSNELEDMEEWKKQEERKNPKDVEEESLTDWANGKV